MFAPIAFKQALFLAADMTTGTYRFDIGGTVYDIPGVEIYEIVPDPPKIGDTCTLEIDGYWWRCQKRDQK